MEVLKIGSRGDKVKHLQKHLNLIADGIFGRLTEEAVREFQREKGLVADGIVGDMTWEQICECEPADTIPERGGAIQRTTRKIKRIIVHCSATREGADVQVADIRKWHKQRGYADIGYHYVITLDGVIHNGRDINKIGAHTEGYNPGSIGVCYVGGLDAEGKAKDTRTNKQRESLLYILRILRSYYPQAEIIGHYDVSPDKNGNGKVDEWEKIKQCPCFDAKEEYKNI